MQKQKEPRTDGMALWPTPAHFRQLESLVSDLSQAGVTFRDDPVALPTVLSTFFDVGGAAPCPDTRDFELWCHPEVQQSMCRSKRFVTMDRLREIMGDPSSVREHALVLRYPSVLGRYLDTEDDLDNIRGNTPIAVLLFVALFGTDSISCPALDGWYRDDEHSIYDHMGRFLAFYWDVHGEEQKDVQFQRLVQRIATQGLEHPLERKAVAEGETAICPLDIIDRKARLAIQWFFCEVFIHLDKGLWTSPIVCPFLLDFFLAVRPPGEVTHLRSNLFLEEPPDLDNVDVELIHGLSDDVLRTLARLYETYQSLDGSPDTLQKWVMLWADPVDEAPLLGRYHQALLDASQQPIPLVTGTWKPKQCPRWQPPKDRSLLVPAHVLFQLELGGLNQDTYAKLGLAYKKTVTDPLSEELASALTKQDRERQFFAWQKQHMPTFTLASRDDRHGR
jgi:hypothetical protein